MPEGPLGFPRLSTIGPLSKSTREEVENKWDECPESGKQREICRAIKRNSIKVLEGELGSNPLLGGCGTIMEINEGRCGVVAFETFRQVDGIKVFEAGDSEHFWIFYKGRHYDAEVPTGVNDAFDLPIFGRISPHQMLDNARMAAEFSDEEPPEHPRDLIKDVTDQADMWLEGQ